MGTAPQVAMVLNSKGVPPAWSIPAFTRAASLSRCTCPNPASFAVFTTPISGRERSSSSYPQPLYMARRDADPLPLKSPSLFDRQVISYHPSLLSSIE